VISTLPTTPAPAPSDAPSGAPVVIVGAGPVGMTTALRLASFGVRSILLDVKPHLVRQGSKACLIQGDVLEVLDKVGCADPIAAEGITWTMARTYVRDQQIRAVEHPRRIGYGPFVNISQYRIEQVLADAVAADPRCDLRWNHEVTAVAQDGDGVTLTVRTPDGEQAVHARYVVAADGVRSPMRSLVGVEWTGYSHADRFLITDVRAQLPLAKERHFHYDPSFNPGRQVVMHPQPDDVWRIDWQLPPDADIEAERADGRLDERVRRVIGDVPYELDWMSVYRFHQRVVARFVVGRVLFAGDAAHSLPPYGSRGMNSGIQDADNLAWKLALVLRGGAAPGLLETYHDERYAAARENLAVTEATIRFMVPPSRLRRTARRVLLALSHRLRAARDRVNSGRMAEPYVYTDSPIVARPGPGDTLTGSFAPDTWLDVEGRRVRLRRLLGAEFVVLVAAPDAALAAALVTQVQESPSPVPLRCVVVLPPEAPLDGADALPADVAVARAQDAALLDTLAAGNGRWWLVRPDGHLAASGDATTGTAAVAAALHTAVGATAPPVGAIASSAEGDHR